MTTSCSAAAGVRLINAKPVVGGSPVALLQKPDLRGIPDVIIGHGRVTGPSAKFLTENHYRGAARLHVVHVAPDELEWWRPASRRRRGARRSVRRSNSRSPGTRCASSPLDPGSTNVSSATCTHSPRPHPLPVRSRLRPGFARANLRRAPRSRCPYSAAWRTSRSRGVDLAAKLLAYALDLRGLDAPGVELLVRGAPPDGCASLPRRLRQAAAHAALHVTVRPFTTDAAGSARI